MKRASIGAAIAFLVVAVLSVAWPSRSSDDDRGEVSHSVSDTFNASAYTPFMGAVGLTPHNSDPLRMAWIEGNGSVGRWLLFTGTASVLSPPDSAVAVAAEVRPGTQVVAWGDWGFLLAEPVPEDHGVVIWLLGPTGAPLAEVNVER